MKKVFSDQNLGKIDIAMIVWVAVSGIAISIKLWEPVAAITSWFPALMFVILKTHGTKRDLLKLLYLRIPYYFFGAILSLCNTMLLMQSGSMGSSGMIFILPAVGPIVLAPQYYLVVAIIHLLIRKFRPAWIEPKI